MKKLSVLAAALVLASSGAFGAGTDVPSTFNVVLGFTPTCTVKTAGGDFSFTYTAFDVAPAPQTKTTIFQCSRGLTPTFRFNDNGGTMTGQATGQAVTAAIDGEGVIAGIKYTLSGSSSKSANGSAATAGTGGTGGLVGSADEYSVGVTAAIPAPQAGDGSSTGGTHIRTLIITF